MHTLTLYFLGAFRPAAFEGETFYDAAEKLTAALAGCAKEERARFTEWLFGAESAMRDGYAAHSVEHGARGLGWHTRGHDSWLDGVCSTFPAFPGLDYSQSVAEVRP